uniref:Uncharacterized protein n=1 Tax=Brassica campestris TaxID=3711 RepID=A0A3P5Z6T0_BRACM|nr:unnamed protein product [Brassica rapa]
MIDSSMMIGIWTNQARSLRNYHTCTLSGRYVASQARSLRSDRALPKRRYDTSPCILVYLLMLYPEDRSEPISCFLPF